MQSYHVRCTGNSSSTNHLKLLYGGNTISHVRRYRKATATSKYMGSIRHEPILAVIQISSCFRCLQLFNYVNLRTWLRPVQKPSRWNDAILILQTIFAFSVCLSSYASIQDFKGFFYKVSLSNFFSYLKPIGYPYYTAHKHGLRLYFPRN